jgi:lipoate-protein ligase A
MDQPRIWRLLDTGFRSAAQNMALDRVILESRAQGRCPDTLRFLQFARPSVLVGYHQQTDQEVRLDFCQRQGMEVNRRITGGGAILFEPSHIGWEIVASREDPFFRGSPEQVARLISEIFCQAIREEFGLPFSFRPRNDIEIRGRKISGTGGTAEGKAFLFQGTLLVDLDIWQMLRALRVPMEKLKAHEVDSLMERVTTMRRELGFIPDAARIKEAVARGFASALGVGFQVAGLTPWEQARLEALLPQFSSSSWVDRPSPVSQRRSLIKALHRGDGGVIRLLLDLDSARKRIRSAVISGDFFAFPARAVYDLESRFKDIPARMEEVEILLEGFFSEGSSPFPSLGIQDFSQVFRKALGKIPYLELGFTFEETHDLFPVGGSLSQVLGRGMDWFLLPYCSKDPACELRHSDGCHECGLCSIGDGYAMAREYGLRPVTVTSFENLMENLGRIRARGARGFIGCCCEGFYVKHADEFETAGVPGLLVAMDSTTCYDLGKARDAYQGSFEHQTHINLRLLRKVLSLARRAA